MELNICNNPKVLFFDDNPENEPIISIASNKNFKKKYLSLSEYSQGSIENNNLTDNINNLIHFCKLPHKTGNKTISDKFKYQLKDLEHGKKEFIDNCSLYSESGLQENDIIGINKCIDSNKVLSLVFDWDQTLICFEGIPALNSISELLKVGIDYTYFPSNWDEDTLIEFLFHSPIYNDIQYKGIQRNKRYILIKNMFQKANKKNIPIYIITNNTIPYEYEDFIFSIIKKLGYSKIKKENILSSFGLSQQKTLDKIKNYNINIELGIKGRMIAHIINNDPIIIKAIEKHKNKALELLQIHNRGFGLANSSIRASKSKKNLNKYNKKIRNAREFISNNSKKNLNI